MRCEMCQMKVIHSRMVAEEKGWYMAVPVARRRSFVKPKVINGNLPIYKHHSPSSIHHWVRSSISNQAPIKSAAHRHTEMVMQFHFFFDGGYFASGVYTWNQNQYMHTIELDLIVAHCVSLLAPGRSREKWHIECNIRIDGKRILNVARSLESGRFDALCAQKIAWTWSL